MQRSEELLSGVDPLVPSYRTLPQVKTRLVASLLVSGQVAKVRHCCQLLHTQYDGGVLHDVRVSLRQLRATLRIYRRYFSKSWVRETRKQLDDLASRTGDLRDADVQAAWLQLHLMELPEQKQGATLRLVQLLQQHAQDRYRALRVSWPGECEEILCRQFSVLPERDRRDGVGKGIGELMESYWDELGRALQKSEGKSDAENLHAVRIKEKYVRYLLEPFMACDPRIEKVCAKLEKLQDILGEFHDIHLLRKRIAELEDFRGTEGYGALCALLRRHERRTYRKFKAGTRPEKISKLRGQLRRIASDPFPGPLNRPIIGSCCLFCGMLYSLTD